MKNAQTKNLKNKNRRLKSVNNFKTEIYHTSLDSNHSISKDWAKLYDSLGPIYTELNQDFDMVDLLDLIYYERWLNE